MLQLPSGGRKPALPAAPLGIPARPSRLPRASKAALAAHGLEPTVSPT